MSRFYVHILYRYMIESKSVFVPPTKLICHLKRTERIFEQLASLISLTRSLFSFRCNSLIFKILLHYNNISGLKLFHNKISFLCCFKGNLSSLDICPIKIWQQWSRFPILLFLGQFGLVRYLSYYEVTTTSPGWIRTRFPFALFKRQFVLFGYLFRYDDTTISPGW